RPGGFAPGPPCRLLGPAFGRPSQAAYAGDGPAVLAVCAASAAVCSGRPLAGPRIRHQRSLARTVAIRSLGSLTSAALENNRERNIAPVPPIVTVTRAANLPPEITELTMTDTAMAKIAAGIAAACIRTRLRPIA